MNSEMDQKSKEENSVTPIRETEQISKEEKSGVCEPEVKQKPKEENYSQKSKEENSVTAIRETEQRSKEEKSGVCGPEVKQKPKEENYFIRSRDVFERVNYLYQLSTFWAASDPDLASYYAKLMTSVSMKSVLRLDSSIKRTVCKGCSLLLIDGRTSRTKFTKNHRGQVLKTCNRCGVQKRFPISKETRATKLA